MRRVVASCLVATLNLIVLAAEPTKSPTKLTPDTAGYTRIITPFFNTYCNACHTGEKPKGEFAIDTIKLPNDFADRAARGHWNEIVNVLNSHEMPPKSAKQPTPKDVAAVVDWITEQAVRAELAKRETTVVLRRLNREEYRNSIRDLVGIDYDVSHFPQDPLAGGFDNNGAALTMSPLHLETYLNAARQILDRAIVEGARPPTIKWRFEPKAGAMDRTRIKLGNESVIVNGNNNTQDGEWVIVHHDQWDKHVNARGFRVPLTGNYIVRLRAASRVPSREELLKSIEPILAKRRDDQIQRNPKGEKSARDHYERDLKHFQTDRLYDYGPARVKLIVQLGPQPRTIAEFDADGTREQPKIHEITTRFTTETAGISFDYAYSIPKVLENFWVQNKDEFARPELHIDWFELEGPIYDAWPPKSHTLLIPGEHDARAIIANFMRKAYRRPVSDAEVNAKLKLFERANQDGASFTEAIKRPLTAILASPHFLYLSEPHGTATNTIRPLTDHEYASRLSYFLWSSCPDAELAKLADEGRLKDAAVRKQQVLRMLADPKSDAFVKHFTGQWLDLRSVGANPPAPDLFPQYDRHLETSIIAESEAFFREILQHDLDVMNFIRSDFVTINERLARFYGIPGVKGDQFRKVSVPPGVHRGGIVTQASILTTTSNGTRTSPVKRGTWILKTLLGIDPGLPVANAGEIAPKVPGIDKATVRKRLEIHRQLDQCARCHNKIDPLGFALENFNAAGEWREQEGFGYKGRIEKNDPKIDASSEMIDGTKIVGVDGLQKAMLAREELFLNCLATKLYTYALGRELGLADQPTVKAAVKQMQDNGRTLKSLIISIATSDAFATK